MKTKTVFWIDNEGVLRGSGPLAPKEKLVEVMVDPLADPAQVRADVEAAYKAKGLPVPAASRDAGSGALLDDEKVG